MRSIGLFVWILWVCTVHAQQFLNGFSLKGGLAISTQAYHATAFLPTIKGHHNIVAPFINLQYSVKINDRIGINAGIQQIEKGFIFKVVRVNAKRSTSYSTEYQYRLGYIEMPLNFTCHFKRLGLIVGWVPSYLYQHGYRYKDVSYVNQPGKPSKQLSMAFADDDYQHGMRFRHWDMGINLGVKYKISDYFDAEITVQKHFLRTDLRAPQTGYADVMYNQSYLFGLRYHFLAW